MAKSWVLDLKQKREILARYRAGELVRTIADDFFVTINTVSALAIRAGLRRRTRRVR